MKTTNLREMYARYDLNALVKTALPAAAQDEDAARWLMRALTLNYNLFLLDSESVALIEKCAAENNRHALFALGRYHLAKMPAPDSVDRARECFAKARSLGLAEASVAIANMYAYGDMGMVDRLKFRTCLDEALRQGCEYAAECVLRYTIFGLHGFDEDPGKAVGMADALIAEDAARYGEEDVNPLWFYWRASAKLRLKDMEGVEADARTAAEKGVADAWCDVALVHSSDIDEFMKTLEKGSNARSGYSVYMLAKTAGEDYDDLPSVSRAEMRELLIECLEDAFSKGCAAAALELGDSCQYGYYGVDKDRLKAWEWYAKGALLGNSACYERMFDMVRYGAIEKEQDFADMLALNGTRMGSDALMKETVSAYRQGRLTEFAAEIEQYYMPLVGDDDETDEDEDMPDDDGRFDAYS